MHLKSLTLKGFKSFAQATSFVFEPGVTCIVGPNGSGKSNVVDALAWVMGEQGAKNLRGGSMADVIFAGTSTRGPLGRAEVVLTIDNADGALPIEYAEVAISRTLFRDGRSEYAINGDAVRLLDVQELLSDSGLGREMHVIVGQGQLDAVLRASAEERRGFIEEAAGILKHRRRRERTLRKLEAMQANLTRLTDLADELRRQLKPLGAQAQVAREAADVQAAVRQARTRLLALDAARLAAAAEDSRRRHAQAESERQVAADAVRTQGGAVGRLEGESDEPREEARRAALRLEGVQQRFRDLARTAAQRVSVLAPEQVAPVADTGAAERAASAAAVVDLERRLVAAEPQQRHAAAALEAARTALADADRRAAAAAAEARRHDRFVADAVAGAATARTRVAAAHADLQRTARAAAAAVDRLEAAQAALAALPDAGPEADEAAVPDLAAEDAEVDRTRAALHAVEREQSAAGARVAALRSATAPPPAVAEVLAALPDARRLQDVLDVDPPWQDAVGAVLGPLADAAVLPDGAVLRDAATAVGALGAVDVVGGSAAGPPPTGRTAASVVRGPAAVLRLLADVALADDLDAALRAVDAGARLAVTAAGELVAPTRIRTAGGSASGLGLAAERVAAEQAAEALASVVERARLESAAAIGARRAAADVRDRMLAAARDRARAARAVAERRAGAVAAVESARAEAGRAEARLAEAERGAADAESGLAKAERAADDAARVVRPEVDAGERAPLADAQDEARDAAVATRLAVETLRERLRAERDRAAALQRRAEQAERAAEAAARRAAERALQRQAAEAVLAELPGWQASVDRSATSAALRLAQLEQRHREQDAELRRAREALAAARAAELDADRRARDLDMQAYEQQVSLSAVRDRAAAELGLDAAALATEAVPGLDRAEEERRLAAAERRLARLGRVNPLALEEFAALEQRQRFLADQLADLQRTRADLLQVVDDLDGRMRRIFEDAYRDTEAAFARIFPVLFPGGSGRLSLTDDAEPGVEVAVRPAGKKIERLSLLSGGERSLAAVAFLLAIFTARPSPFYILDEVEAALDDANLGRLLEVVSSLRDESQLILITHQKRTMEIADALYGVSMRQDGISAVVGQRLAARAG